MSLLDFFPNQRRLWQQQPLPQPADYLAGGLAALAQAEAAFRATPLLNARQLAATTQQELEEVSYQLSLARKHIEKLQSLLDAARTKDEKIPRLHQRRAYNTRKKLREVAAVANHPEMRLEKKVLKIQNLANEFLARVGLDDDVPESGEAPTPAVPLPE